MDDKLMQCARKIAETEGVLGTLSHGQLKDLLLDHFDWILDCEHAERILILLCR